MESSQIQKICRELEVRLAAAEYVLTQIEHKIGAAWEEEGVQPISPLLGRLADLEHRLSRAQCEIVKLQTRVKASRIDPGILEDLRQDETWQNPTERMSFD